MQRTCSQIPLGAQCMDLGARNEQDTLESLERLVGVRFHFEIQRNSCFVGVQSRNWEYWPRFTVWDGKDGF